MSQPSEVTIICAENCGNSPKKELLRDLAIAFVNDDVDYCLAWVRDDLIWNIVGVHSFEGTEGVKTIAEQLKQLYVKQLEIDHIITHGNTAALNGTIICHDEQTIFFCQVYQFDSFGKKAKIKQVTSYIIHEKQG